MNNLINLDAINALDLSSIKNAALVKESESLAALQAKIKSGAAKLAGTVDAVQREQAIILNRIQATKLYEKDGFKSLKEYGETIGLSRAAVYALSNAGKTYGDKDAPDALKNMSPYNVAAVASAINSNKEQVYKDAADGKLSGMTQDQLRDYATVINQGSKGKVVKTYVGYVSKEDGLKEYTHENASGLDQRFAPCPLESWLTSMESTYGEAQFIKPDKDGNKRILAIYPNGTFGALVTLKEYKPTSNGKTKVTAGKAEFLARAAKEGMTAEQIKTVIRVMGW